jgi:putative protease
MMEKEKVGEVFHYFTKAGVAAINLTDSYLQVGDTVLIQGVTTNLTQKVESMQVENTPVQRAETGQSVGIKVSEKVREKDLVYRVIQD